MDMDFERICRLCLESNKQSYDIFSSYYFKRNILYLEMITNCTKLKPNKDDGLPKLICKDCTKHLKRAYAFNIRCENSDKKLKMYLENLPKLQENSVTDYMMKVCTKTEEDEKDFKDNSLLIDREQKVLEVLDPNVVSDLNVNIKVEPNFNEDGSDSWDADDNVMLEDIKLIKMHKVTSLENGEKSEKKKRGRKKRVFLDGEHPPIPISKTPHQCDVCGKVLSTKSNLKAHKICHTDVRPYKCADCPASFRGHSALYQHKKIHSGETPYHCEYCPKQFSRRTGLVNHIRMHTGERLYSCKICLKAFVQSAQLTIHMRRHKGDKPFLCQDCGKGFPIKADLKVHQRIHNGEKPYSCHLCTKTFATSGNLSIHVRIHKKEIRYNCKECQRGFVTNSAYNIHLKRHKGQKDYHCECGKTFYTSSALKQHKVVHTGEKKYQCKICDRKFTQTSHLSRHYKRDHTKPNSLPLPSEHYKVFGHDQPEGKIFRLFDNAIQKIGVDTGVKCEDS